MNIKWIGALNHGPRRDGVPLMPGAPMAWCICGAATAIEVGEYRQLSAWQSGHMGDGHRWTFDKYRAVCRSVWAGCRNCGSSPAGRLQFYCSAECRTVFERDHFWSTARHVAIERQRLYDVITHRRQYIVCARCGERVDAPEVNHRNPVNGDRQFFGCQNHLDGLEALCHSCHLVVTAEQRSAGMLGPRARVESRSGS